MNKLIKEKINESFSSVLPISIIVLLISVFWVDMHIGTTVMFLVGAALLVVGMGIFTLGVDMSMLMMGEGIGEQFSMLKNMLLVAVISFGMGMLITVAEPDLRVLATQISSIPNMLMILTVAAGVGLFMVTAVFRIVFGIPLSRMLLIFYILLFTLSFFVPKEFLSIAFDSGGVTTGPITVPFILALGVGFAASRGGHNSQDDSFGMVALCSIGPILTVLILGILYDPKNAAYAPVIIEEVVTTRDVAERFFHGLPEYFTEVAVAVLPIVGAFLLFQVISRRYNKYQLLKITIGFAYTFIGLILFLTGVNVGFLPVGNLLGKEIAASPLKWLLIPLGMLMGYFIVLAEPAVHVLNNQVEEVSGGTIKAKAVQNTLSIGIAVSVGIAMLRVLTGINIYWFLIPGYAISLTLMFFVPKIFTGIAFDSGGVASGPMTSAFLLPFTMGACEVLSGGDVQTVLTDAFGIVAMVAMTPLVALQILGFIHKRSANIAETDEVNEWEMIGAFDDDDEIAEFDDSAVDYATAEELLELKGPFDEEKLDETMLRR